MEEGLTKRIWLHLLSEGGRWSPREISMDLREPYEDVRKALLDLFPRTGGGATPQVGTKAKPGPLYGISTHAWAALGVAVTVAGIREPIQEVA